MNTLQSLHPLPNSAEKTASFEVQEIEAFLKHQSSSACISKGGQNKVHPQHAIEFKRSTFSVTFKPKYATDNVTIELRYLWVGEAGAPTLVVQGGISANRDVLTLQPNESPGWWQEMVGAHKSLDLNTYQVLAIDWLTSTDLHSQLVSTEDQAEVLFLLTQHLQIVCLHALIGCSYGAMVGMAFAHQHPQHLNKLILIAGAHRPHPLATAQRCIQREMVRFGLDTGQAERALSLARQLAITTYRGRDEFGQRFAGGPEWKDERFQFPVESYLDYTGRRFVERFTPEQFLSLSQSIDLHDIWPEKVLTHTLIIGFSSDLLVPFTDLVELHKRLKGKTTLIELDSPYGHDAFLKETTQLTPLLTDFLAQPDLT